MGNLHLEMARIALLPCCRSGLFVCLFFPFLGVEQVISQKFPLKTILCQIESNQHNSFPDVINLTIIFFFFFCPVFKEGVRKKKPFLSPAFLNFMATVPPPICLISLFNLFSIDHHLDLFNIFDFGCFLC